jgi:hypothetical protein
MAGKLAWTDTWGRPGTVVSLQSDASMPRLVDGQTRSVTMRYSLGAIHRDAEIPDADRLGRLRPVRRHHGGNVNV